MSQDCLAYFFLHKLFLSQFFLVFRVQNLTANEILAELEEGLHDGDGDTDIYLLPPEGDDDITDEDSDEEEELLGKNPNHLGRGILSQEAELVVRQDDESDDEDEPGPSSSFARPLTRQKRPPESSSDEDEDEPGPSSSFDRPLTKQKRPLESSSDEDEDETGPSSSFARPLTRQKRPLEVESDSDSEDLPVGREEPEQLPKKKNIERVWHTSMPKIFGMAVPDVEDQPLKILPEEVKSPYDFFTLFLTDQFVDKVVEMSKAYAVQKDKPDLLPKLTHNNIRLSHAIMFMTGYISPSNRRMYWEEREDTRNTLAKQAMSRTTFEELLKNTHFTDKVR